MDSGDSSHQTMQKEDQPEQKVAKEGFTSLANGGQNPSFDIVLIHGIQGHPKDTWTFENNNEPEKGIRHIFKKKSKSTANSNCNFWPKDDLPRDFPDSRVLTYGYDSHVTKFCGAELNLNTITDHAESFLNSLVRERKDCPTRPLLFLVHSLGGLILKSALTQSATAEHDDLRSIKAATFAIIFFGTPHRGSGYADIGLALANIARATGAKVNVKVLESMKDNGEILTILRRDFSKLVGKDVLEITSFRENKGYSSIPTLRGRVVDPDSCSFDDLKFERGEFINANHMNMVKFEGPDDPEYKKVVGEIERHIARLRKAQNLAQEKEASAARERENAARSKCIESLYVPKLYERPEQIARPIRETLGWIYGPKPGLSTWLKEGSGIFWIRGKAGSGKSTAMKYLYLHHSTMDTLNPTPGGSPKTQQKRSWKTIGFFFTNRDEIIQRQLIGILHSMVFELLNFQPELIDQVLEFGKVKKLLPDQVQGSDSVNFSWTTKTLQQALLHCKSLPALRFNICFFIDGLDEHEGDHKAMASFLRELVTDPKPGCAQMKVCVASRPEQPFEDIYRGYPSFTMQDFTSRDILSYITQTLGQHPRLTELTVLGIDKYDLSLLFNDIATKAEGVFQWVVLMTKELESALSQGLDTMSDPEGGKIAGLRRIVQETPPELHDYYRQTLLQRIDVGSRRTAYIMLESILRAKSPLTLVQLGMIVSTQELMVNGAYLPHGRPGFEKLPDPKTFADPKGLERLITTSCRGLLELQRVQKSVKRSWSINSDHSGNIVDIINLVNYETEDREESWFRGDWPRSIDSPSAEQPGALDDLEPTRRYGNLVDRQAEIELMNQAQHTDYFGGPDIDLTSKVKLIHRSAKDFLLQPGNLDCLFAVDEETPVHAQSKKPKGNGHTYILDFCSRYAKVGGKVGTHIWKQMRLHWNLEEEVKYHAPRAEATDALFSFEALEKIDDYLTGVAGTPYWPEANLTHWCWDFASYAAATNMQGYIKHILARDPDLIREKPGRSLLHFTTFTPGIETNPSMTKLLLSLGADVNAKFEGKTPLESMVPEHANASGEPLLSLIRILLDNGANVNGKIPHESTNPARWYPLIHVALQQKSFNYDVRSDWIITFLDYNANLNLPDSYGGTFMEILYWYVVVFSTIILYKEELFFFLYLLQASMQPTPAVIYTSGKPSRSDISLPHRLWKRLFKCGGKITLRMLTAQHRDMTGSMDHVANSWRNYINRQIAFSRQLRLHHYDYSSDDYSDSDDDNDSGYSGDLDWATVHSDPYDELTDFEEREAPGSYYESGLRNMARLESDMPEAQLPRRTRELRFGIYDECPPERSHEARDILRRDEFRNKKWYTDEAVTVAFEFNSHWELT